MTCLTLCITLHKKKGGDDDNLFPWSNLINDAKFQDLEIFDTGAERVFTHSATRVILSNFLQICHNRFPNDVNADAAYVILEHRQ